MDLFFYVSIKVILFIEIIHTIFILVIVLFLELEYEYDLIMFGNFVYLNYNGLLYAPLNFVQTNNIYPNKMYHFIIFPSFRCLIDLLELDYLLNELDLLMSHIPFFLSLFLYIVCIIITSFLNYFLYFCFINQFYFTDKVKIISAKYRKNWYKLNYGKWNCSKLFVFWYFNLFI